MTAAKGKRGHRRQQGHAPKSATTTGAAKKSWAGKKSGEVRAGPRAIRRFNVLFAFERLMPKYQTNPFSLESLDALEEEYRILSTEGSLNPDSSTTLTWPLSEGMESAFDAAINALLEKARRRLKSSSDLSRDDVSHDTLRKDLIALGIRSKRRTPRSG